MLRKFLLTTAILCVAGGTALAADLPTTKGAPVYAPPPPPPPAFTWSGLYIGGQVGYDWGRPSSTLNDASGGAIASLPSTNVSGVVGGAHIGYNYQVSQFVFGLEGDVNGSGARGSSSASGIFTPETTRETIDGSLRGRVGVAFDRLLVYGTGGVALANFKDSFSGPFGFDSISKTRPGWTVGGGLEYALTNNWSIRAEYRYTDYGRFNNSLVNSLPGTNVRTHQVDNRAQVGFSYKFDMFAPPGAVAAKY